MQQRFSPVSLGYLFSTMQGYGCRKYERALFLLHSTLYVLLTYKTAKYFLACIDVCKHQIEGKENFHEFTWKVFRFKFKFRDFARVIFTLTRTARRLFSRSVCVA